MAEIITSNTNTQELSQEEMQQEVQLKLKTMEEANFRELYHRFQYIECPEDMESLGESFPVMEGATGILTYCYIEEGLGLSFYILCAAKNDGNVIEAGADVTEEMARVRYRDVWYRSFADQDSLDVDWSQFDSIKGYTKEQFETKEKLRQMIYDLELIDGNRNVECPEYVSVIVQKEGLYPEYVWVKCTGFGKTEIHGELLEPPKQDGYQLKTNDKMTFQMVEAEGKIYLMWMPEAE